MCKIAIFGHSSNASLGTFRRHDVGTSLLGLGAPDGALDCHCWMGKGHICVVGMQYCPSVFTRLFYFHPRRRLLA